METIISLKSEISQIILAGFTFLKDVSWPVAAVFIAALFRSDFRNLIPRIQEAGPTGVKFTPHQAEQQQKSVDKKIDKPENKPQLNAPQSKSIEIMEQRIKEFASTIEKEKVEATLIRLLSQAKIEAHFEMTYNYIFGSQIEALKRLNQNGPVNLDQAKVFFKSYEDKYPQFYGGPNGSGFDSWIRFLIFQELVKQDGNIISITDIGRDFLIYIISKGRSENKPW